MLTSAQSLIPFLDLTSLDATDHQHTIERLCHQAMHTGFAPCAAVCIWSNWVSHAKAALQDSSVHLACVAGAFPFSQAPLKIKVAEIQNAVSEGAQEIDLAIHRGLWLSGQSQALLDELSACKAACGPALFKVILETSDLPDLDSIRCLAQLCVEAGADFLKTSTGKGRGGATPEAVQVLLEVAEKAPRPVGIKVSGGVRTVSEAMTFARQAEAFWPDLSPKRFRIGASSLLGAILSEEPT